jgi:hypothetical protein
MRARLMLGERAEAWASAERALALAKHEPIEDPTFLRDVARLAREAGALDVARVSYRAAAARAHLIPDPLLRTFVLLEAASAALSAGPVGLDEARALVGAAEERGAPPGFTPWTKGLLALVLDRQGRGDAADALARQAAAAELPPGAVRPELPALDTASINALLAEAELSPTLAKERWQTAVNALTPGDPWADYTRARASRR